MYPRSIRIRPSAPPLLFWNVSASTTCSRVTFPILVSTRPIGRPWSWSIGGMPPVVEVVDAAPPPLPAAEAAGLAVPGAPGVTCVFGPGATGIGALPAPPAPLGGITFGGTLFAGTPPLVGGALAPTLGALGGVTFGLFAGIPGAL